MATSFEGNPVRHSARLWSSRERGIVLSSAGLAGLAGLLGVGAVMFGCASRAPEPTVATPPPPPRTSVASQVPPSSSNEAAATAPISDAGAPNAERPGQHGEEQSAPIASAANRHRASVLDGAAKPSKIAPGDYMCRVDAMYKLRPCKVTVDDRGFTWLETPDSLLHLKGVLYDTTGGVTFEGSTGEERPFGCFSCQERCSLEPSSCVCQELLPAASRECLEQPLRVKLTKNGAGWSGTLHYTTYFNEYEGDGAARHVASWSRRPNSFVVEIQPAPKSKGAPAQKAR